MAGDGQRRPDVVPGAICSQFSLTEEFEKTLLVSVKIGSDWWIYFDYYRDHHYGAMRTRDWKRFETIPVTFPADTVTER